MVDLEPVTKPFVVVLGAEDMAGLPEPVRIVHSLDRALSAVGRSDIEELGGLAGRLFCWGAGLPKPGCDVPVTVDFQPTGDGREDWRRRFGARRYASTMRAGTGRDAGLLIEHFGLFDLKFALTTEPGGLRWRSVGWRLLGLALPVFLMPRVDALESGAGQRFTFDIHVAFAWLGPVLRYKGWLEIGPLIPPRDGDRSGSG